MGSIKLEFPIFRIQHWIPKIRPIGPEKLKNFSGFNFQTSPFKLQTFIFSIPLPTGN
jgi:hypothetical protein